MQRCSTFKFTQHRIFKFTTLLVTSTRTSENTLPSSKSSVYLFGFRPAIMHLRRLSKVAARLDEPSKRDVNKPKSTQQIALDVSEERDLFLERGR